MSQPSISDVSPEDDGGRISRSGYQYQDLCALRYSIRAACGAMWDEVWCESHDDIVLYAARDGHERYRFVQVKFVGQAGQHWTPHQVCAHEPSRTVHHSILCKLLSKDRYAGVSDFRLATNLDSNQLLEPMTYRWNRTERPLSNSCQGVLDLANRLRDWVPSNGRSIEDHVLRFAIESHAVDPEDMESMFGTWILAPASIC